MIASATGFIHNRVRVRTLFENSLASTLARRSRASWARPPPPSAALSARIRPRREPCPLSFFHRPSQRRQDAVKVIDCEMLGSAPTAAKRGNTGD